jgi:hypothetical protein
LEGLYIPFAKVSSFSPCCFSAGKTTEEEEEEEAAEDREAAPSGETSNLSSFRTVVEEEDGDV